MFTAGRDCVLYAASRLPSLTSFCGRNQHIWSFCRRRPGESTHQSAHGAVQRMPMVPSELGVGALQGRVSVCLWLLDTVLP